jgi:hypothetical protein
MADDIAQPDPGAVDLRFGVVTARTDPTTTDAGTATIKGIDVPILSRNGPAVGARAAYLEMGPRRLCLGEYGYENPACKVSLINPVSLVGNTPFTVGDFLWDTNSLTEWQQGIGHSQVSFPGLLYIQQPGRYWVSAGFSFAPGDGYRMLALKFNGTIFRFTTDFAPNAIFGSQLDVTVPIELSAGDYVSVGYVHNNSTGNINANGGTVATYLSVERSAALL